MKNTKNLLITGLALAITLFASVPMTAMNQNETKEKIRDLELKIALEEMILAKELEILHGFKYKNFDSPASERIDPTREAKINQHRQKIRALTVQLNNLKAYQNSPLYDY